MAAVLVQLGATDDALVIPSLAKSVFIHVSLAANTRMGIVLPSAAAMRQQLPRGRSALLVIKTGTIPITSYLTFVNLGLSTGDVRDPATGAQLTITTAPASRVYSTTLTNGAALESDKTYVFFLGRGAVQESMWLSLMAGSALAATFPVTQGVFPGPTETFYVPLEGGAFLAPVNGANMTTTTVHTNAVALQQVPHGTGGRSVEPYIPVKAVRPEELSYELQQRDLYLLKKANTTPPNFVLLSVPRGDSLTQTEDVQALVVTGSSKGSFATVDNVATAVDAANYHLSKWQPLWPPLEASFHIYLVPADNTLVGDTYLNITNFEFQTGGTAPNFQLAAAPNETMFAPLNVSPMPSGFSEIGLLWQPNEKRFVIRVTPISGTASLLQHNAAVAHVVWVISLTLTPVVGTGLGEA